MSLNPLNELKRRLADDDTPLSKRLCLAKNLVYSHHFPTAPKERVIGTWLQELTQKNMLSSRDMHGVLDWLNVVDDVTGDFKSIVIQIVSHYVQNSPLENNDMQHVISFLENDKINSQLNHQIDDYLNITITMLQCLRNNEQRNINLCKKLFNNMTKYYKECKKKLEFIVKLLNKDNIESVFSYLDTELKVCVIDFCGNILFPINKKSFFISYLQTLIRKDNIEELILEKGDNIQSVLKIMNAFFDISKQDVEKHTKFIRDFVDVFVSCLCSESQVVFAFYIVVANFLNMQQKYIVPAMNIPVLIFDENDEKIKRNLFLNMLEILLRNEVDISVRLTDTFGEKLSKVETKKTFMVFLQTVMMGQVKLEGKIDKTTLQIIKTALKLDPILIEQKMTEILPPIMFAKKNSSNIIESYTEMLNCLLEILFKLSRGTLFVSQILPFVKILLEACNTEQFELKQKLKEHSDAQLDCERLKNKIITGKDLFPDECVEMYGKLTCDLMFRQNRELLELFQKDFEEHCLLMLDEGFVSPSIITLAEVLSTILSSFLRYNKMADTTVPQQIAEDFWDSYKKFEAECLTKYGECVLKLTYNAPLVLSFLKLCQNFAQLKLLNIKYSNVKLDISQPFSTSEVFDFNFILPCLSSEQWIALSSKIVDDEAVLVLDNLLLVKSMAIELLYVQESAESLVDLLTTTKTNLIKGITRNTENITSNTTYTKVLFRNLDRGQCKQLAKGLVKTYLNNGCLELIESEEVGSNILLLNALVIETVKSVTKCFDSCEDLTKSLNKSDFNIRSFVKEIDMKDYFSQLTLKPDVQDTLKMCVDLIKRLKVPYLQENYQLVVILLLLAIKRHCQTKKIRRNVDQIMQSIYELSLKSPDLYTLFPVDYIFSFEDKTLVDLLTLKMRTSNDLLIIKCILETAVKKVKTNSEIVKSIVNVLLKKNETNIMNLASFSDPVFQITCIMLPLIAKHKKAITASAFRTILADLQEKLHKEVLESFKNIDFNQNRTVDLDSSEKTDVNMVDFSNDVATLNAMGAYSLTLSKYCETTDAEEIKNLDCLWSGLEYFFKNAVKTIENSTSSTQHIESSLKLIVVILRYIKKLETHQVFQEKDKFFISIWRCIKARLILMHDGNDGIGNNCFNEDISVALKFLCESTSVECFVNSFIADLTTLTILKKPIMIIKDVSATNLTSYKVSRYLWSQCLKSNIVGAKCVALSKLMYRSCKTVRFWLRQHFDVDSVAGKKRKRIDLHEDDSVNTTKIIKIDERICELLKVHLDTLCEVILAAKKVSLDYKFIDTIFSLQHMVYYVMGVANSQVRCEVTSKAYFELYDGCIKVLNSLLVSREEVLEDRWPNYMQCYRTLIQSLCERSSTNIDIDSRTEEKLTETAYNIEKLTQSISKRKKHVSRIAAYTVGDVSALLEKATPTRSVRQHLENSVALLIQAADSTYAMAFLKRALAGNAGQMTMTNLYTMYKRYHKYVGNA